MYSQTSRNYFFAYNYFASDSLELHCLLGHFFLFNALFSLYSIEPFLYIEVSEDILFSSRTYW